MVLYMDVVDFELDSKREVGFEFITVKVRNDLLKDQFIKCANKEKLKQEKIKQCSFRKYLKR